MPPIIYLIIIFILVAAVIYTNSNNVKETKIPPMNSNKMNYDDMPYHKKNLLTKAEYSFYIVLKTKCDINNLLICPKVRLEDIAEVNKGVNYNKYRGYIKSRHVDFVICDHKLRMLAAVELDDNTHKNNKKVMQADMFKDALFNSINMPLYRVVMSNGKYETYIDDIIGRITPEQLV